MGILVKLALAAAVAAARKGRPGPFPGANVPTGPPPKIF
jgi:hypothetical protein